MRTLTQLDQTLAQQRVLVYLLCSASPLVAPLEIDHKHKMYCCQNTPASKGPAHGCLNTECTKQMSSVGQMSITVDFLQAVLQQFAWQQIDYGHLIADYLVCSV